MVIFLKPWNMVDQKVGRQKALPIKFETVKHKSQA